MSATRDALKRWLGPAWSVRLRCLARGYELPEWGNLRRTRPFSEYFGFERGTPVDRFYLDRFLSRERAAIRGDVLEVQVGSATRRYGSDVAKAHTVDIRPDYSPTYLCDLARSASVIPSDAYDCFLLPNTLSFLRDLEGCLRQALRIVRPGGTILATASGIGPLTADVPDYWRLSADGWREVAARVWPGCEIQVVSYGNALAAVAAVLGLAHEELSPRELDVADPRYPVLVSLRCRKPERS